MWMSLMSQIGQSEWIVYNSHSQVPLVKSVVWNDRKYEPKKVAPQPLCIKFPNTYTSFYVSFQYNYNTGMCKQPWWRCPIDHFEQ